MKKNITLLSLEEIENLTKNKKLSKKELEVILLSVSLEKTRDYDIEEENDKIDSLSVKAYEKTLYGKKLLNKKLKYLVDNFEFSEDILSNAFRFCTMSSNLENAKYLLENSKFKIVENSLSRLKSVFPFLYSVYLKTQIDN